jgi:hypothetical protein
MEQPDTELPQSPQADASAAEVEPSAAQVESFEPLAELPQVARPDDYVSALASLRAAKMGSASESKLGDATGDYINNHLKDQLDLYKTTMA